MRRVIAVVLILCSLQGCHRSRKVWVVNALKDFVTEETLIKTVSDTHFRWLNGVARLSKDGTTVEFEMEDGRSHRVGLTGS